MTAPFRLPALLAAPALPGSALAGPPDPSIGPLLDGPGYEVDQDGDYRPALEIPGSGRTQLVFVRSPVEGFGSTEVREVWSPAWTGPGALPEAVANRLLEASGELKLGGWARHGQFATMTVQVAAAADAAMLEDAITSATLSADRMQQELAGHAGSDEY